MTGLELKERPAAAAAGIALLPLKRFQERAAAIVAEVFGDTALKIEADPSRRLEIALAQGTVLLRSPTGSGKTLTIGRGIERMVGRLPRRTCWFWFAPYAGLVAQTRNALQSQCPGLRLRDLKSDRDPNATHDGDVFIATWASVASATRDAKRTRQTSEEQPSVDVLAAWLHANDWHIGVVVDEAHLNFGSGAKQAAAFYLDVLRPDFTVLATATPKDDELDWFRKAAGMGKPNRIEVSREEAVRSCLNKVGVKAVHFRADPKDENILDMGEVAIYAGLARHRAIKAALAEAGVRLAPLMLVQVDNSGRGESDPARAAKDFLTSQGVSSEAIAIHTSGEPDPHFHTLAYDETKEVLIFKMAAATGFDAPRAWTLVTLRTSAGIEFGHQVLGRIMRVHPRVQHLHPFFGAAPREPTLLDYGHVFLANPSNQVGIARAADELRGLVSDIETVTDDVTLIEVAGGKAVLLDPAGGFKELLVAPAKPQPAPAPEDVQPKPDASTEGSSEPVLPIGAAALFAFSALESLVEARKAPRPPREAAADFRLEQAEMVPQRRLRTDLVPYPLRKDISFPRTLAREVMPKTTDGLVACIARRIGVDADALALVHRTKGKVAVTEADVFGPGHPRVTSRQNVPLSNLRISQQSQLALRFNDSIDERDLKPALKARLQREFDARGWEAPPERDLRRAVDMLVMARPELLHDACRQCLAEVVEIRQDEEIPIHLAGPPGLEPARLSVYGVFPDDMNEEELAFARALDDDESGTVQWWLRNVSNARWAVSIVLPTGKLHFPDFVIGVDVRRRSKDSVALVEVKDDGKTGRLFSTSNTDKVRTEHREYRSALMVYRDGGGDWYRVGFRADIGRHVPGNRFRIEELVWTT